MVHVNTYTSAQPHTHTHACVHACACTASTPHLRGSGDARRGSAPEREKRLRGRGRHTRQQKREQPRKQKKATGMRTSPDTRNQTTCAGERIGGYARVGGRGAVRETLKSYIKEGRKEKNQKRERERGTYARAQTVEENASVLCDGGVSANCEQPNTQTTTGSDERHTSIVWEGAEGKGPTDRRTGSERDVSVLAWHTPGCGHHAHVSTLAPFFAHPSTHLYFHTLACLCGCLCVRALLCGR